MLAEKTKETVNLVIVESPFFNKDEVVQQANVAYARECIKDSLLRGESPFASHLLYTQVLDDNIQAERTMGIEAGLDWGKVATLTAVYTDRGISEGMKRGIARAEADGRRIEYRSLFNEQTLTVPVTPIESSYLRKILSKANKNKNDYLKIGAGKTNYIPELFA